jgi:hypothetical protein
VTNTVLIPLEPPAWLFELTGGTIGDFEETCIPKSQRETAFMVAALHRWEMGVDDLKCVNSAEDVTYIHSSAFPRLIGLCSGFTRR